MKEKDSPVKKQLEEKCDDIPFLTRPMVKTIASNIGSHLKASSKALSILRNPPPKKD